jgi:hypothetical protein
MQVRNLSLFTRRTSIVTCGGTGLCALFYGLPGTIHCQWRWQRVIAGRQRPMVPLPDPKASPLAVRAAIACKRRLRSLTGLLVRRPYAAVRASQLSMVCQSAPGSPLDPSSCFPQSLRRRGNSRALAAQAETVSEQICRLWRRKFWIGASTFANAASGVRVSPGRANVGSRTNCDVCGMRAAVQPLRGMSRRDP